MAEFDPVPIQYQLTVAQAELYIPSRYVETSGAEVTPREFALQLLVDDNPMGQPEIGMYQRASRGNVDDFFRFMSQTLQAGAGRHVQHVLMAMSLHPDRDSMINVVDAGTAYLEESSRAYDDILGNRILLASLATEACCNVEENIKRAQLGDVHVPT